MQAGDEIVKVAAGPGGDDGRRGRRAALPARAPAAGSCLRGAADPGAQPRLAGLVPGAARATPRPAAATPGSAATARRRPGRASGRSPVAGDRPRERHRHLVPPRRPRRRAAAGRAARPVPHPAPAARPERRRSCAATRCPGRPGADDYRISVKREPHGVASTYLHTPLRVGDRARGRRAARHLHPRRPATTPVRAGQRRRRRHPGAGDAARARRRARSGGEIWWLHGARNGSRPRLRRRGARAARRAPATRAVTSATAAPAPTTSRAATSTRAGRLVGRRCSPRSTRPGRRGVPLRARRRSWTRSRPPSPRSASPPRASTPSCSGPRPA